MQGAGQQSFVFAFKDWMLKGLHGVEKWATLNRVEIFLLISMAELIL